MRRTLTISSQSSVRHRWTIVILLLILLVASALRLAKLDQFPPGLHVDEAPNAWNAYTLLKTGMDQHGIRWPIFYTRAFGENRSTSYIYALLPFQAIGGLNVWTTRLPSAIGGVITVLLIYFVGARLFGCSTGLVGAALLALNPWHIQASRWGHESSIVPLFIMASLAALVWANMPFGDDEKRRLRPMVAVLAGALTGISCYGYFAVRLFLPIFFIGAVLVTWRAWRDRLKSREGALAICVMVIAGAVTFGPLLWRHLTDPEITKRARIQGWVWDESDSLNEKVRKVLSRYPGHFGPDFLFISGDGDPALSPPLGTGLFHGYELPFMILGLMASIIRFKSSRAARVLLVWIVLYPVADLLNQHPTLHSLRSLPGLGGLILLEAVGAVWAGKWLWQHQRQAAIGICYVIAVVVLLFNIRFLSQFFGRDFYGQKYGHTVYAADILEATQWLRPRLNEVDAVFITGLATHPDIITLVGLGYDPQQWFRGIREVVHGPLPDGRFRHADVYLRYGKIHFMFGDSSVAALKELIHNGRPDRVIFIVRPGELGLHERAQPVYEIRSPEDRPVLWIFDLHL